MAHPSFLFRLFFLFIAALGLSGCFFDDDRASAPLSKAAQEELARLDIPLGAPVFIRIFKEESVLEVWLKKRDGTYHLFRSYGICHWSGALGPKLREGDRQAPEGFYMVFPQYMNPKSKYYLSFNLGYPNVLDQALGRTGSFLMVHGGCRSAGCYAITDASIQELYTLAREAFSRGQTAIEVHAFPFKMTAENMARHRESPWFSFWENLQEGYLFFEKKKSPPIVGIMDRRYVFLNKI